MPAKINSSKRACKKCGDVFEFGVGRGNESVLLCSRHLREYRRSLYRKNSARWREGDRDRYRNDPEFRLKKLECTSEWQKRNPGKCRARNLRYQERYPFAKRISQFNRRSGASLKHQDIYKMLKIQLGACPGCGCGLSMRFEVDHIVPRSKSGSGDFGNLQLLCAPCNRAKHTLSWDEFINHARRIASHNDK